jgi:hypothetical protein
VLQTLANSGNPFQNAKNLPIRARGVELLLSGHVTMGTTTLQNGIDSNCFQADPANFVTRFSFRGGIF